MATVPTSGTDIRLLSGVPFNSDYKNTRWFTSKSSQTNWFLNRNIVHSISEANFQRIEGYHFIAVNKSIDALWGTNYVMFRNSQYNNKWFYGFVTNLEYKQRNNTHVYFQIDVLQTWRFEMNFKPSYVVREHTKLWEESGVPVINTIDEGLDYGNEYDVVHAQRIRPQGGIRWFVVIAKETMHDTGVGKGTIKSTVQGVPQPLTYYFVPFDDKGRTPLVDIGGDEPVPLRHPTVLMDEMYSDEGMVNNVVSIYITDYIGVQTGYRSGSSGGPDIITLQGDHDIQSVGIGDGTTPVLYSENIEQFTSQTVAMEGAFEHFRQPTESKLLMYPYTVIILDDFKGNRVEFRPEYMKDGIVHVKVKGSLGTSNFVSYSVEGYNMTGNIDEDLQAIIDNENALINNNPEDISVLNDMLAAFMQGNRNSIQAQRNQAVWSGITGTLGAVTGGAGAGARLNTANQSLAMFPQLTRVSSATGIASAGISAVKGMGDTVLQLQQIQAKQDDISNKPPQLEKMGTNTAYNSGNSFDGVWLLYKQIKPEYRKILEDFFGMFGYKVNRVKVPNFRTRQNWNYVQTESCVITGNFNNEDLQEIKNVFDNGITLWHTDDIGNYSLSNGVR